MRTRSSAPAGGGGDAAAGTSAAAAAGARRRALLGAAATLAWMAASAAVIMANKTLYSAGYDFPLAVTAAGQLTSAAGGVALAAATRAPLRRASWALARENAPIVGMTAATMFFGNAAYLHLSVAFIQILKARGRERERGGARPAHPAAAPPPPHASCLQSTRACITAAALLNPAKKPQALTPGITLALALAAGVEAPSAPLAAAIAAIGGGTAGALAVEAGAPAFSGLGVALFVASSATEAARAVLAQVLMARKRRGGGGGQSALDVLVHVGWMSGALLAAAAGVAEGRGLAARGAGLLAARPGAFAWAAGCSLATNLSSFLAIGLTSSLTFKVAGCVKNLAVVWWSVVAHGETVAGLQMACYALSAAGFLAYARVKQLAAAVPPAAAAAARTVAKKAA